MSAPSTPGESEFLIYKTDVGEAGIEVRLIDETVWLSLDQMAGLFQRDKSVISRHISNMFSEGELDPDRTVAKFATVQTEGNRSVQRDVVYYNLDVIISVGYRVKFHRGTQFRIWATQRLREYLVKGFTMNDDLLKRAGGGNYFEELLERIRDIRSSEEGTGHLLHEHRLRSQLRHLSPVFRNHTKQNAFRSSRTNRRRGCLYQS